MVTQTQTAYFLFFYLLALAPCAVAQTASAVPTVEVITARMAQALTKNRAQFRPYSVTRDYKLFGKEKGTTKSEVIAEITFVTPGLENVSYPAHRGQWHGRTHRSPNLGP